MICDAHKYFEDLSKGRKQSKRIQKDFAFVIHKAPTSTLQGRPPCWEAFRAAVSPKVSTQLGSCGMAGRSENTKGALGIWNMAGVMKAWELVRLWSCWSCSSLRLVFVLFSLVQKCSSAKFGLRSLLSVSFTLLCVWFLLSKTVTFTQIHVHHGSSRLETEKKKKKRSEAKPGTQWKSSKIGSNTPCFKHFQLLARRSKNPKSDASPSRPVEA